MEELIRRLTAVLMIGGAFVVPLTLGFFLFRQVRVAASRVPYCARCGSRNIDAASEFRISPLPSLRCYDCGLLMRPNGSGVFYGIVLGLCLLLLGFVGVAVWVGDDGRGAGPPPFGRLAFVLLAAVGASVFIVRQLLRPAARRGE